MYTTTTNNNNNNNNNNSINATSMMPHSNYQQQQQQQMMMMMMSSNKPQDDARHSKTATTTPMMSLNAQMMNHIHHPFSSNTSTVTTSASSFTAATTTNNPTTTTAMMMMPSESLFGTTVLPQHPNHGTTTLESPHDRTTQDGGFHPVDEYKDMSLRDLLDLTDDFLMDTNTIMAPNDVQNCMTTHWDDNRHDDVASSLSLAPTPLNIPDSHTTVASYPGICSSSSMVTTTPTTTLADAPLFPDSAHSSSPMITKTTDPKKRPRSLMSSETLSSLSLSSLSTIQQQQEEEEEESCTMPPPDADESSTTTTTTSNDADWNAEGRFRPYQAGQWSERFQDLLDYRSRFGNCLVPHTYTENLPLARWVKRQRYQFKLLQKGECSSTMTAERVQALQDIGFVWDSQAAAWGERYHELVAFGQHHRHCNVPSNYAANPQLATWVKCQRRQYKLYGEGKATNMTAERIQQLEAVGFEWLLRSYKKARTE